MIAIVTGMLRHEFVKALSPHLVGNEIALDEIGAEVLLEEAYDDSVQPHSHIAVLHRAPMGKWERGICGS